MNWLRHSMTLALAAMVSAAAAAAPSDLYAWHDVTMPTPSAGFLMENGTHRHLADFKGQVVLLNLWATWCTPCLKELPTLDKLEESHAADGLVVIPLSVDTISYEQLRAFVGTLKLELPHLAKDDSGKLQRALGSQGLPLTYLIGRDGKLLARYEGATDWMGAEQTGKIEALLRQPEAR